MATLAFGRSFAASGASPDRPRIAPNRQQIDDRFPVLGFTIDTGGLPYFEVLLTTDRANFDPANAGRRTKFYSSRQDSGLIRAETGGSVYVAPTAVLRSFVPTREIFYTVIAYKTQDGQGASFAIAPESLASEAPSVSVAAGFEGATLAAVFGTPVENLYRLRSNGDVIEHGMFAADPASDRGEGEDGYSMGMEENEAYSAAAAEDAYSGMAMESDHAEDEDDQPSYGMAGNDADYAIDENVDTAAAYSDDDGYDDGFDGAVAPEWQTQPMEEQYGDESESGNEDGTHAYAQERFPPGSPQPAMLEDEDDQQRDSPEYSEASYTDEASALSEDEEQLPPYEPLEVTGFQQQPGGAAAAPARTLTPEAQRRIIDAIAPFESGRDGYAAINADGEFEGRFGTDHPAYQRYHVGLSYGRIQFTQDGGKLGVLLRNMRSRDPQRFRQVFGEHSDALVDVTTAPGPPSRQVTGGRSARVQPVPSQGGADLWREPWLARFRAAAAHPLFQGAQNEVAASEYLAPMIPFARWLGLNTDRAVAMVFDRSVQMGPGGAQRWIIEAVGPVQTAAQRQQALTATGHQDIQSFQRATPGLAPDGDFGPLTHAAMVAALRALGARSPLPIPSREQMMDAMVRHAGTARWAHRLRTLRSSSDFDDAVFQL